MKQCDKSMSRGKIEDLPKEFIKKLDKQPRETHYTYLEKASSLPKTAEAISPTPSPRPATTTSSTMAVLSVEAIAECTARGNF